MTHRISVSLTNQEYADLQEVAEKHRVSLAWVGRQAISEFLSNHRNKENKTLLPIHEAQKGQK